MSDDNTIETTAETVEEAIAIGLEQLGVGPNDVIVEVLEEPTKGVFGLGARPARVRIERLIRGQTQATSTTTISRPIEEATPIVLPTQKAASETPDYLDIDIDDEDEAFPIFRDAEEVPDSEHDDEAAIGKVVLGELLERMSIRARIVVRRAAPGEQGDSTPWILDINGSRLERLIGRRGETLAALQYITRLVTSRELQHRSEIIVDVDGYKAKRARTLYGLALRMADEAVAHGRTVALEPMPPHERRIVHLALRNRADVTTRSIGEGQARKVTIVPKTSSK